MQGELVIERPTLICLGFQWYTEGVVIFDAQGNDMLFDVQNAQHLILAGLTIKDADFAVYAGCTLPMASFAG